MKRLMMFFLLLFAGGVISFAEEFELPFGSPEKFMAYQSNRVVYITVQVYVYNDTTGANWQVFYQTIDKRKGEWDGDIEVAARLFNKKILNRLLEREWNDAEYRFVTSCSAWDHQWNRIYGSFRAATFTLVNDTNGNASVPEWVYELRWETARIGTFPVTVPNVTRVRVATQDQYGNLMETYDSTASVNGNLQMLSHKKDMFKIRYDLATDGNPGLVTVTTMDPETDKVTQRLFSLADGRELTPLALSRSFYGDMMITVTGNPERDLVVQKSYDLTTWETFADIPKTSIGERTEIDTDCGGNGYYRIRPKP